MKTAKLMALALCAASTAFAGRITQKAVAAEGDVFASATPPEQIADPVNPKPGMLFKGYNLRAMNIPEMPSALNSAPALKESVSTEEKFACAFDQGVWEGFLKCNRSANCTLVISQRYDRHSGSFSSSGYVLFVNGKKVACAGGEHPLSVDMKAGYNHIKLIAQNANNAPVFMSLKQTGSTAEPKPMTPKDFWYDEKPDPGDMF